MCCCTCTANSHSSLINLKILSISRSQLFLLLFKICVENKCPLQNSNMDQNNAAVVQVNLENYCFFYDFLEMHSGRQEVQDLILHPECVPPPRLAVRYHTVQRTSGHQFTAGTSMPLEEHLKICSRCAMPVYKATAPCTAHSAANIIPPLNETPDFMRSHYGRVTATSTSLRQDLNPFYPIRGEMYINEQPFAADDADDGSSLANSIFDAATLLLP